MNIEFLPFFSLNDEEKKILNDAYNILWEINTSIDNIPLRIDMDLVSTCNNISEVLNHAR